MRYLDVAEAYGDLEGSSGRLVLIGRLAGLVRETPDELLPMVALVCQGQLVPDVAGVELGLAARAAAGGGRGRRSWRSRWWSRGCARSPRRRGGGFPGPQAGRAGRSVGAGDAAGGPVAAADGHRSAAAGDRRGDLLDALAEVHGGGRGQRPVLEWASNICSDLEPGRRHPGPGGAACAGGMRVRAGNPVRPMLAQRMGEPAGILAKLGGRCAGGYKDDGIGVQATAAPTVPWSCTPAAWSGSRASSRGGGAARGACGAAGGDLGGRGGGL